MTDWMKQSVCMYAHMHMYEFGIFILTFPTVLHHAPCPGHINGFPCLVASDCIQPMIALVEDVRTRFVHATRYFYCKLIISLYNPSRICLAFSP